MTDRRAGPTREDVAWRWIGLIEGRETRQSVHDWAAQWVGVPDVDLEDPMVDVALLYLHGFGLFESSTSDDYLHSDQDIVAAFERWRTDCLKFDTDREGYLREKRAAADAYLEQERRNKE